MVLARKPVSKADIPFDVWKLQLRKDCEVSGRPAAFDAMGDYVLQLLWARGLEPTARAIIEDDPGYESLPI